MGLLLANVPGFASSNEDRDLYDAIPRINPHGYSCGLLVVDAKHFVPQRRQRLFIVSSQNKPNAIGDWEPSNIRPAWIAEFVHRNPELDLTPARLPLSQNEMVVFSDVAARLFYVNEASSSKSRLGSFMDNLSPVQYARLKKRINAPSFSRATAYRRTRNDSAVWEIRADDIAGCLRTPRGGSSKQVVVGAGHGNIRTTQHSHIPGIRRPSGRA